MIGFTKERIEQFIKSPLEHGLTRSEQMEMARQLLASMDQEPAAQVYQPENIGICAPLGPSVMMLKPLSAGTKLYAAPQLPQPAVGDGRDQFEEWFKFHHGDEHSIVKLHRANGGANYRDPHVDLAWIAWKDSRAAMLQGAEPVIQPDELPLDYRQGHKDGLEWAARLAEANHPQTGDWLYDDPLELAKAIRKGPDMPAEPVQKLTLREGLAAIRNLGPIDAGKIQAERDALNEPVQGWIPCSERMPEEVGRYWCYVEEQNSLGKSHYQWNCSWNGDRWWVESENGGRVTHWMPLPAAPQQQS